MGRKRRRSNGALPTVFLPKELIAEILSYLNVKTILRFKCLSKSWNTFISSNSNFVEKHLKNSPQNSHLTLVWHQRKLPYNVVPFPVHHLFKNKTISLNVYRNYFRLHPLEPGCEVVGSCNGLLCLLYYYFRIQHFKYLFCFLNPATGARSKKLGLLACSNLDYRRRFKFTFGYDTSTKTYKVVAFLVEKVDQTSWKSEVKVFNLGDNCWKNIQSFPSLPFEGLKKYRYKYIRNGVHLSGTVNWMAMNKSITHVQQFVILSLDLSTETYTQFLLPLGFDDDVSFSQPALRVLMDCLCFSHDYKKIEFILWQMKEYGVQESWTQLLKISYQDLEMHLLKDNFDSGFQLACLYVNDDNAIFAYKCNEFHNQAFIYNLKDNTVKRINCRNSIGWFYEAEDYVESLVPVCWESATPT